MTDSLNTFRAIPSTPTNSPLYGLHSVRDSNQDLHLRAGATNGSVRTSVFRILYVAEFRTDDERMPQPLHASANNGSRRLIISSGNSVVDHESSTRKRTHRTTQPPVIAKQWKFPRSAVSACGRISDWAAGRVNGTERYGHVHGTERDVNAIVKHDTRGQTRDIRRIFSFITEESNSSRTAEVRLQRMVQRHATICAYLDLDWSLRKGGNYSKSSHDTAR